MNLSIRLNAIGDMVPTCNVMADIGTDHGYLPIEMVKKGRVNKAYAMDVNKGPLLRAVTNIDRAGESERVITVLSDGLSKLPEDVEVIVIAGMGGMLISKILEANSEKLDSVGRLVLSPHLDDDILRRTLHKFAYVIEEETMVEDQGKYYNIMSCVKGVESYSDLEYQFGKKLIEQQGEVFVEHLKIRHHKAKHLLDQLGQQSSESAKEKVEITKTLIKSIEAVIGNE